MKSKTRLSAGLLAIVMILSTVACPIFSFAASVSNSAWVIQSPDGKTAMGIDFTASGGLVYSVVQDSVMIVEQSDLGIQTSVGDFTKNLILASRTSKVIDETYDVLSGKKSTYTNSANEMTFTFREKEGVQFSLIVRVYNDGIAFRYVVDSTDTSQTINMEIEPNAEKTSFDIPDGSRIWYMDRTDDRFVYEYDYKEGKIGETAVGTQPSMPMLYEVGDKYALITEADRTGSYTGSLLRLEANGEMRTIFDLTQKTAVKTTTPFTSPWRTVIIGSAAEIMENTMVENLSPAPDEDTYKFKDWVDPGVSSWSWVSYYGGQRDPAIHEKFIDLAADMGWEYYILDEGWQPNSNTEGSAYEGMSEWFPRVRDYAKEKGVKLIAWVRKDDIDTPEEREARFKEWSEAGIVGIKADFFYYENQEILQLYDDIYRDAAEYHLMVNIHGGNPSAGEIRTWPNVISREAIKGQEQGGITVDQYTLIPFIRAAVGSADVTEQLYSRDTEKTSMGFQIALSTLIENGIRSLGSMPEEYYSVPEAVSYYRDFPQTWDELKVIDAVVGEKVSVARRSGDTWFAAGITTEEGIFSFNTDFLDPNKSYVAVLYSEAEDSRTDLETYTYTNVTSKSSVLVHVQAGGGYAIKFVPMGEKVVSLTANTEEMSMQFLETAEITLAYDPETLPLKDVTWSIDDRKIARLTTTGSGVSVFATKVGTATLTATSVYDNTKAASVKLTVNPEPLVFNNTDWEIFNENTANYEITGKNSVEITTKRGMIYDGNENIFAMKAEHEDFEISAKISGGLSQNWQGGFIGVFTKDENHEPFVAVGRRYHTMFNTNGDFPNNHIAVMSNEKVDDETEAYVSDPNTEGDVYVRLVKDGNTFTGYYKVDKTAEWQVAFSVENAALAAEEEMYVGFWAGNGGSDNTTKITISEFTYNGKMVKVANAVENTSTYEAEDAVVTNGALVSNIDASSNYHVDLGDSANANVTYTINRPYISKATVRIYYYASEASKLNVSINGSATVIDCPATTDWDTIRQPVELEIRFVEGDNTIVLSGVDGAASPDIDYIDLVCPDVELKSAAGTYEMENGVLEGNAAVVDGNNYSNKQRIGNVGGANNGRTTFDITSNINTKATINIYYSTANGRPLSITVNGTVHTVECGGTGGWDTIGTNPISVEVELWKGVNTIVFGGVNGADAPNLDYFVIRLGEQITADEATPDDAAVATMTLRSTGTNTIEAEAATLSGDADVVNAAASSNGQRIGNIGGPNNGTATFSLRSEVEADATMNVYYATAQNRKLSVTVNDDVYNVDCASTGSWDKSGTPVELDVHLEEGVNTIAFGGVNGEWAPNLDEFTVEIDLYDSAEGSYEMEDGKLSGSAEALTKSGCSNGKRLGNIGGPDKGTATFEIEHDEDGKATIMVYYATVGARNLGVTVNGKLYTVNCPSTGGWNAPGKNPAAVTVELKKGVNTIAFGGVNGGWAPNLDKFEIVSAVLNTVTETYEMENGTRANGATLVNNNNMSGGKRVGNIGGASNGNVTFTVSSDAAGKSAITVYYATNAARKLSVTVNGKAYTIDCKSTGGWEKLGNPVEIEVDLAEGENTIVFGGVNGGWAPNLDKFEIEVQQYA